MRAVLAAALLLGACTRQQVDESAHIASDAAPLLVLVPGAGPACVVAAKAACLAAEAWAEWPNGPGTSSQ